MSICKGALQNAPLLLFGRAEAVAGVPVSINPNHGRHSLPRAISATKTRDETAVVRKAAATRMTTVELSGDGACPARTR